MSNKADRVAYATGTAHRATTGFAWAVFAVALALTALAQFGPLPLAEILNGASGIAVAMILVLRRRTLTGGGRRAITLNLLSFALLALHSLVRSINPAVPGPADIFGLLAYLGAVAVVIQIANYRSRAITQHSILDALVLCISVASVQWVCLAPLLTSGITESQIGLTVLYAGLVLLVTGTSAMSFSDGALATVGSRIFPITILAIPLLDISTSYEYLGVEFPIRSQAIGILVLGTLAAAVADPSFNRFFEPMPESWTDRGAPRLRLLMLGASLAALPAVTAFRTYQRSGEIAWQDAVATAAIAAIFLRRVSQLLNDHVRAVSEEHVLRRGTAAMANSQPDELMERLMPFVESLAGRPAKGGITPGDPMPQGDGSHLLVSSPTELGQIWISSDGLRPGSREELHVQLLVQAAESRLRIAAAALRDVQESSERRFSALVRNSADILAILDAEGRIQFISPAAERLLGSQAFDLIGHVLGDLLQPEDAERAQELISAASQTHENVSAELRLTTAAGTTAWIEVTARCSEDPEVGHLVINVRDVTERKDIERELRHRATHDHLTGLGNRTMLTDQLRLACDNRGSDSSLAVVFIDLDDFKDVNDTLGHSVGDQLLVEISRRITQHLGYGDLAARLGGDEFALVLERFHGEYEVAATAETVLEAITRPITLDGRSLNVGASAGIAFDHDGTHTAEALLAKADAAMYLAKQRGKHQWAIYEDSLGSVVSDRFEFRAGISQAVERGELRTYFQPVYDLATGQLTGAEALVRWLHPDRGLVGPANFVPLIEDSPMISQLGSWVFNDVLAQLATWRSQGAIPDVGFTVSVNVAPLQLAEEGFVAGLAAQLRKHGVPPRFITVELTERTVVEDTAQAARRMEELRSLGVRVAVDDFGTGYSSLRAIRAMEFDVLKIDRSFVVALDEARGAGVVTAILDLARGLRVRVIAEGIESEWQAERLLAMGCEAGQGYLFARPLPAAEFQELVAMASAYGQRFLTESQPEVQIQRLALMSGRVS